MPSVLNEASVNLNGIYSEFATPLSQRPALALVDKKFISASVVLLVLPCCPPAIARKVTLAVIYSVDACVSIGTFPHIFQKVFKLNPAFADGNTSGGVILEIPTRAVAGPNLHHPPRIIFFC